MKTLPEAERREVAFLFSQLSERDVYEATVDPQESTPVDVLENAADANADTGVVADNEGNERE